MNGFQRGQREADPLVRRAYEDADSVVALASELIQTPSRAGVDPYTPGMDVVEAWLASNDMHATRLRDPDTNEATAILVEVEGGVEGPSWLLNACLDTAPFGDESAWSFLPTDGHVVDGFLRGRGAADSKSGAAMFCHIARAVQGQSQQLAGRLLVLLDVDEHTGRFGGARSFLDACAASRLPSGAMIGYPGTECVVLGGRGVLRAQLHVHGVSAHSGSSRSSSVNAVSKAARLVALLEEEELPGASPGGFPLPPKLTVTAIRGGDGFTTVPDLTTVSVDVRTTDTFDERMARDMLDAVASELDRLAPSSRVTEVDPVLAWPHYSLSPDDQPAAALLAAAARAGLAPTPRVAGPTNIGNLFAMHGVSVVAGFGLPYVGLHGIDEQADIRLLPTIQAIYHRAVMTLMQANPSALVT